MRRWAIALAVGAAWVAGVVGCDPFGTTDSDLPPPLPEASADGSGATGEDAGSTTLDANIDASIDRGTGLVPVECGIEKCPNLPSELDNCKREGCSEPPLDFHPTDQIGTGIKLEGGKCRLSSLAGSSTFLSRERDRVPGANRLYELAFDLVDLDQEAKATIVRVNIAPWTSHVVTIRAETHTLYLCEESEGELPICTRGLQAPLGSRLHLYGTVNGDAVDLPRFGLAVKNNAGCTEELALELRRPLPLGTEVIGAIGCIDTESPTCSILVDSLVAIMRM